MAEGHTQMEFDMLGMHPLRLFIEPQGVCWERMLDPWLRAMLKWNLICSACLLCVFSLSREECLGSVGHG